MCDKGFIWNSSNCDCESDKSCDVGEYLNYENCKCRKRLVDKLVKECTETVKEVKLAKTTLTANEDVCKYSSFTLYILLLSIIFTFNVGISTYFVYYKYMNRKKILIIKQHFIVDLIKWLQLLKALTLKIQRITFLMT